MCIYYLFLCYRLILNHAIHELNKSQNAVGAFQKFSLVVYQVT